MNVAHFVHLGNVVYYFNINNTLKLGVFKWAKIKHCVLLKKPYNKMLVLNSTFFFPFIFISWRLITLQYCSGFCHTLTWISHEFTCGPHPDPPSLNSTFSHTEKWSVAFKLFFIQPTVHFTHGTCKPLQQVLPNTTYLIFSDVVWYPLLYSVFLKKI